MSEEKLMIKGKITKILESESGTSKAGKAWTKQNFVIDTGAQYNPEICFEMFGKEKVEGLQKYNKVGQDVEVYFNVSSREYSGKYFHNLSAWMVKSEKAGGNEVGSGDNQPSLEEDDGLPF